MSGFDASKISIIKAKKANGEKLSSVGDTDLSLMPKAVRATRAKETKCNLCCMAYGGLITSVMTLVLTASATAVTISAEKRVHYSLNGAMRQVCWIAIPGVLIGTSLHFFLSEAMWSGKHNTWGQAWTKAILFNSVMWGSGIGFGTLAWRYILPRSAAGRRLFHRYPVPSEPLETRVLRTGKEFFTGMGWSFWTSGLASGQIGFMTCVSFCVYNDRPYLMMAPQGGYAQRCMPPWRRELFEAQANV